MNIKNPELDKYKGEPKDEIKITIGEKDLDRFVPNIEIKRWNEVSFKIKPDLEGIDVNDMELEFSDNKIKFKTPKMEFEMEDFDEGYKFIWYLNSKPPDRTICFDMESSGLDFFYQPELTQQEIDEGAFRPENVVGSYVFYHKTKGGMVDVFGKAYGTGQGGILYRPRLYDSNGLEVWAERLLIKDGQYCVILPEGFWNEAVYPIKSNDNFGYETVGGTVQYNPSSNDGYATKGTPTGGNGDGVSISVNSYVSSGSRNFKGAICLSSNGSFVTNAITPSVDVDGGWTWYTGTFASQPSIVNNTTYWIIYVGDGTNPALKYNTGSGEDVRDSIYPYADITTNVFVPNTDNNRIYSIYATYTPGNGAPAPEEVHHEIIIFD